MTIERVQHKVVIQGTKGPTDRTDGRHEATAPYNHPAMRDEEAGLLVARVVMIRLVTATVVYVNDTMFRANFTKFALMHP